MAVYVDPLKTYHPSQIKPEARSRGREWCHMIADTPEELHALARRIGVKREWFQDQAKRPALHHYDLTPSKRALAVARGAEELTHEQFRAMMAKRVNDEIAAGG